MSQPHKRTYSQFNPFSSYIDPPPHQIKITPYIPTPLFKSNRIYLIYEKAIQYNDITSLPFFREHTTQILLANDQLTRHYLKIERINQSTIFGTPMEHSE